MQGQASSDLFLRIEQPFLNYWKGSKSYASFVTFFLAFTACRMVWVPYFLYQTYAVQLEGDLDFLVWPSAMFYVLQLAWYAKMCSMVLHYRLPREVKERLHKEQ